MKILKHPTVLLLAFALFAGACASKERVIFNTLYSVEHTTTAAYDGFLYGVVRGQIPTNNVPVVSQDYDRFQIGMKAAIEVAQYDVSAPASTEVVRLSNIVLKSILEAKAR